MLDNILQFYARMRLGAAFSALVVLGALLVAEWAILAVYGAHAIARLPIVYIVGGDSLAAIAVLMAELGGRRPRSGHGAVMLANLAVATGLALLV